MSDATLTGVQGKIVTAVLDNTTNAKLAQNLVFSANVGIIDYETNNNYPNFVAPYATNANDTAPGGTSALFVNNFSGSFFVPSAGTELIFDTSTKAHTIHGGAANSQNVIIGSNSATLYTNTGVGTVIAGGGNNLISSSGGHYILEGNGNDTVYSQGNDSITLGNGKDVVSVTGGNDTINAGIGNDKVYLLAGNNLVTLDSGNDLVSVTGGNDTINAGIGNDSVYLLAGNNKVSLGGGKDSVSITGNGSDTVDLTGGTAIVHGDKGKLLFVNTGGGLATVLGGTTGGSVTVFGGTSGGQYTGGSGGNNSLVGGNAGATTLIGGGSGDTLVATAGGGTTLQAGSGSETLVGDNGANDTFRFIHNTVGNVLVSDFLTGDKVNLAGYGYTTKAQALANKVVSGGSTVLTLLDGTKITFSGIASLTASDIKLS